MTKRIERRSSPSPPLHMRCLLAIRCARSLRRATAGLGLRAINACAFSAVYARGCVLDDTCTHPLQDCRKGESKFEAAIGTSYPSMPINNALGRGMNLRGRCAPARLFSKESTGPAGWCGGLKCPAVELERFPIVVGRLRLCLRRRCLGGAYARRDGSRCGCCDRRLANRRACGDRLRCGGSRVGLSR